MTIMTTDDSADTVIEESPIPETGIIEAKIMLSMCPKFRVELSELALDIA